MYSEEAMFGRFSGPAILFLYKDGDISTIQINSAFLKEQGFDMEIDDFVGSDLKSLYDEESLNIYLNAVRDVIATKGERMCENRRFSVFGDSNSEMMYIRSMLYYVEESDGGHLIYDTISNITQRATRFEQMRVIIQRLAEGYSCIYQCDFENNYLKIIKQDEEEAIVPLEDGPYSENIKKVEEAIDDTYKRTIEHLKDLEFVKKGLFRGAQAREFNYSQSSKKRWFRTTYYALETRGRIVTKALVTNTLIDDDLAKRYDTDILLAKQKKQLEERQEMLISAVEEANKANSAKTAFFSNMSHDIRTPMNAIVGYAHLARRSLDDRDKMENYIDKINIASDHMLTIINDILDMSRIESGKMEVVENPENIKDVVDDVYDIICQQMAQKKIDFVCDYADIEHAFVYCDRVKMRQILLNLLSNAYKFTPEEGRVVLSLSESVKKDKSIYKIVVKDSGIGMSEEYIKKIWEPFSREEKKEVYNTQGTGLGMSIVKSLVALMKGNIKVKSKLGAGTEFVLTFPFEICEEQIKEEGAKEIDVQYNFDGKKILVVEDIDMNREIASEVLEGYGATVMEATNGIEAVDMVKESKEGDIDLILMDITMPVMDGYEATRRIRAFGNKALAEVPIIAMTANAFEEDIKEAKKAGMNAHIAKPFDAAELARKINKYMMT